ncbi:cora-like Mg2+ transporter protein-domain-containing protein [Ilyonectria robusta]|uniref:cora-like Mg2+ transporter protein-domain-containing protein n=1 Tax=Ilyonectria robusta TaxID=1079257 RepID=UPI001E8DA4A1|nr:cora-like Mg2+ transporter protein-domain-containing protein [Ilyonectria robusta]KAH8672253.1 cora-like Mg2+ transporter protein-domain-containing protein [Ilyonectria robusta]
MSSFHLKRGDILEKKGEDEGLSGRLLKQGMDWINLRSAVREMAYNSRNFAHEYHKRHQETDSIKDLLDAIDNLSDGISKQISRLDEISKDLIQMEFNLVSINEARKSTSLSTSMKRLSWITFTFLPLTFISGLFGMNVDILESNPYWWWYIPFAVGTMLITATVWIIFKLNPHLEDKIEKEFRRLICGERPRVRR